MQQTKWSHCPQCRERRKASRTGANHLVHGIITLLLVGLWLPIWAYCAARAEPWRCDTCGAKTAPTVQSGRVLGLLVAAIAIIAFALGAMYLAR